MQADNTSFAEAEFHRIVTLPPPTKRGRPNSGVRPQCSFRRLSLRARRVRRERDRMLACSRSHDFRAGACGIVHEPRRKRGRSVGSWSLTGTPDQSLASSAGPIFPCLPGSPWIPICAGMTAVEWLWEWPGIGRAIFSMKKRFAWSKRNSAGSIIPA